jgi:hypothetical protein
MNKIFAFKVRKKISDDLIADMAFILFFSNALVRLGCNWLLGTNNVSKSVAFVIIYLPVFLLCILNPRKYIKLDFLALMAFVLTFFIITIIIHPEYEPYYTREDYGIWDHVLIPFRGLYAYLFVRLVENPKRIQNNMKISGWCMFIYFFYEYRLFLQRGYWYGVAGNNAYAKMSYSVSFGYEVLLFALFFFYAALEEKKVQDIVASVICLVMILAGGSRGPVLFIGLFFVVYILIELKKNKYRYRIMIAVGSISVILYMLYDTILKIISNIIKRFGTSSRFIETLLNGSVSNDSGRSKIWGAAVQMIKDNPFGYGAMGSRHIITDYIYAGYPHSVILEILIDFGVPFGSALLVFLLWNAISILYFKKNREWRCVFLPMFCASCSLFISLTYWSIPAFWATIGIGVNCYNSLKRKKQRVYYNMKNNINHI